MIEALARMLDDAVEAGALPAAQLCVLSGSETFHASAHGSLPGGRSVTAATLFDVASLTKVVATTSLAYVLLSRRVIDLDERAIRWLPELAGAHKAEIRIRHLLAHTSGLPAWLPLFARIPQPSRRMNGRGGDPEERRQRIVDAAAATPLERFPGAECVYSDLGFILLGELLSRAGGAPLDVLFSREIASPLGLRTTAFRRLDSSLPMGSQDIAPTGDARPRPPAPGQEHHFPGWEPITGVPPEPPGVVDDDNAWAMGGIAGHAGLFSTASEIARWAAAIQAEREGAARLGDAAVLEELLRRDPHEGPPRALGFDLPSGEASSAGRRLGRSGPLGAAGHLGFTGCSVWIDFDRRLSIALLTNRVHPSRANVEGLRTLRPLLHEAVLDALESTKR